MKITSEEKATASELIFKYINAKNMDEKAHFFFQIDAYLQKLHKLGREDDDDKFIMKMRNLIVMG